MPELRKREQDRMEHFYRSRNLPIPESEPIGKSLHILLLYIGTVPPDFTDLL